MATFQPPLTSPTTFSIGVRAPSKNTSLNSDVPVSCTMGRISMPGWRMGTSRYEMPRWRGRVAVGAAQHEAPVGPGARATSRPSGRAMTHSSPSGSARVCDVGEVRPGVGLGVALTPDLGPGQDAGQEPALLLVGAELDDGRPEQPLTDDPDPARPLRPGVLLVEDDLLAEGQPPPAVLARPADADPAGGAERPLPRHAARRRARARRRGRPALGPTANSPERRSVSQRARLVAGTPHLRAEKLQLHAAGS